MQRRRKIRNDVALWQARTKLQRDGYRTVIHKQFFGAHDLGGVSPIGERRVGRNIL